MFIQNRIKDYHLKIGTVSTIVIAVALVTFVMLSDQLSVSHASMNESPVSVCGTSIRNHIALNGKIDVSFCISHNATLKVVNVSYIYTFNGTEVRVQLRLNHTGTQHYTKKYRGLMVNVTEIHEWWTAKNIPPPDRYNKGILTIEYSGGTARIPVQPGYIPETTVYRSHTQTDFVPSNLPLIVTAVIAIALLAFIKALL